MRFSDLIEAPVSDVQTYDYSEPDRLKSFRDPRDWALVSKPGLQKRLIKSWSNSKHNFQLHFYRLDRSGRTIYDVLSRGNRAGIMDDSTIQYLRKEFRMLGADFDWPDPKPGIITVLFIQHAHADNRFTPWIMAHRMAHGILNTDQELKYGIKEILIDMSVIEGFNSYHIDGLLLNLFTMKSIRQNETLETDELVHELVAQYVIQGGVRLNQDYPKYQKYKQQFDKLLDKSFNKMIGQLVMAF